MHTVDPGLIDAAKQSVNFGVLAPIEPLLAIYGAGAESGVYTDPNGALIKCRQFGEVLADEHADDGRWCFICAQPMVVIG